MRGSDVPTRKSFEAEWCIEAARLIGGLITLNAPKLSCRGYTFFLNVSKSARN